MKKVNFCFFMALFLAGFSLTLDGAFNDKNNSKNETTKNSSNSSLHHENSSETQEKFNLMERDENEDSDTLAIPFDDSEVEDEEEIDAAEKKNVFDLPRHEKK
jgi:hypothetical protein